MNRTLIAALLTVGVAGCSASATSAPHSRPPTTATLTVSPPAASTPPPPVVPSPTFRALTAAQTRAALIPLSAMPTGWSEDTQYEQGPSHYICGYTPPAQPTLDTFADYFTGSGLDEQLREFEIRQFASPAAAAAAFTAYHKELAVCPVETYQGQTIRHSVANAPQIGGLVTAADRTDSGASTYLRFTALVGPAFVSTTFGSGVVSSGAEQEDLFREQVTRYQTAASR